MNQQGSLPAWRALTPEQREREYSPSSCIGGDYAHYLEAYKRKSTEAYTLCKSMHATWHKLRYHDQKTRTIFLAVPASYVSNPALVVFFHGGYWQELSALDSLFAAHDCITRGFAFAAVDYTLAPEASVRTMAAECEEAVRYLFQHSNMLGVDKSRFILAGHSAGAHLAAQVCHSEVGANVAGAVLISGIYDLMPLVDTTINLKLHLDYPKAREQSPQLAHFTRPFPRTIIAHGENETAEFKRQSADFAQKLRAMGTQTQTLEVAGKNHFDVVMDLCNVGSALGAATLSLIQSY